MLINAVKGQQHQIEAVKKINETLQAQNHLLANRIFAQVQKK